MENEFFLHELHKPNETTLAAPLAMPLHLHALPQKKTAGQDNTVRSLY
jgi:hypothetical protein